MWKNQFRIAFRNLWRHKGYSFINIAGLAVGVASAILILLYVQDELSYDAFHPKADRIYRVLDIRQHEGIGERSASAPTPLAEAMLVDYEAQIEAAVRFFNFQAPSFSIAYEPPGGDRRMFNERRLYFTDPEVFDVFDYSLQQGNVETALSEPKTVVLTETMARKYFGGDDPVGKTLRLEGQHDFQVTGVLSPIPSNSHLQFDFLASFASLDDPALMANRLRTTWIWNPSWTYLLLADGVDAADLERQFPRFVQKNFPESRRDRVTLQLQPLTDIHLHSHLDYEMHPNSDIAYVYIFSAIALVILLIACINFTNLTTAQSSQRAREIGVRKVMGANRPALIRQFLGESVLLSVMAMLVAAPLVALLLPVLNEVSGKVITLDIFSQVWFWGAFLGLSLIVGVAAGLYPAFFLSSFRPAPTLKGDLKIGRLHGGMLVRRGLVVAQFTLSVVLIIGTLVAYNQLRFLRDAQLGFDKEQVVMVSVFRSELPLRFETFKNRLRQISGVRSTTLLEEVPGKKHQTGSYQPEGHPEQRQFPRLFASPDVVETLGLDLVAGRDFSYERGAYDSEVIINEAMIRHLGWSPEEALGKRFDSSEDAPRVVGVVEDFHYASLHQEVGPFAFMKLSRDENALGFLGRYAAVRLNPGNVRGSLDALRDTWQSLVPDRPFEAFFLDDELDALYRAEENLGTVAGGFSFLAILVACLGLFGLAAFTAQQRTKEVGVRKVLGATVTSVAMTLSKDFVKLAAIAVLLAWPIAYVVLDRWLDGFAYQVAIDVTPFLIAGALAVVVALVTVSYEGIRAALADPVKSLRYE